MPQTPAFSYSSPDDSPMKRAVIRGIEMATGQPHLRRLYETNRSQVGQGETFWDIAVRCLQLQLVYDESRLQQIPASGPVVVVANHPFGVLDGIVIANLLSRVRTDFRILTNALLYRAPEIRPYLLPIDFSETREALGTNLDSRRKARDLLLRNGGAVVVFPAGAVSTARRPFGRATDSEWKPFTGELIQRSRATVVPVFFEGQNSWIFQAASLISQTLRLSLLFNEVHNKIGTDIPVHIGQPLTFESLAHIRDRRVLVDHLRHITYGLGTDPARLGGELG